MTAHYKHTIRRKWLHLCSLFLCTGLLTTACSNNIEEASGGMASTAPVIQVEVSTSTLNANDHLVDYPDTTTLMGTQHVTHVMLYIFNPENHIATRITLRRRVAGVAGWFKNVPAEVAAPLTQGVTDRRLSKLRIALYTAQNTVLPLIKRQQKPDFEDFIASASSAADATTLVEIPITPDNTSKGIEQTFTGGSFVLPIPAPADKEKYTLRIELVNKEGQVLDVRRAKLPKNDELDHGSTGGGTGIIDTESAYRFPIVANHYYGLGSPHKPIDLKGSGADFTITVDPTWNEEADLELGEKN